MPVDVNGNEQTLDGRQTFLADLQKYLTALPPDDAKSYVQNVGLGSMIVEGIFEPVRDAITKAFEVSVNYILGNLYGLLGVSVDAVMVVLKGNRIISDTTASTLTSFIKGTGLLQPIIAVLTLFTYLKNYADTTYAVTSQESIQALQKSTRYTMPSILEVLRCMFVDPSLTPLVRDIGAKQGLSEQYIDMVIKAAYAVLPEGTIREVYFRRGKDESFADTHLSRLGYTPDRIRDIKETWAVIPPPGDLITMAVREAFSESQASALGLDAEFPDDFARWSEKVGMSGEWARKYWRAHWQLPSASQGFEMYQRGVIAREELEELLKALDYSPVWRDKLLAINYNPVTRVDVRRMYASGVFTVTQVFDAYMEAGYSPENASALTEWTIKQYKDDVTKLTRAQIDKGYKAFYLSRVEVENLYEEMGYTPTEAKVVIDLLTIERETDVRDVTVQGAKKLYLSRNISRAESRQRLESVGLQSDYVDTLLEEWDVEILLSKRVPSKTDCDTFYSLGLLDPVGYAERLGALGYGTEDIKLYMKTLDIKAAKAAAKESGGA